MPAERHHPEPDQERARPMRRIRGPVWLIVLLGLLALNWGAVRLSRPVGPPCVKVPFNPYFLQAAPAR
jgi:hypothetical protein